MQADRSSIGTLSPSPRELARATRSAVTNHKDLLPGLDGRSASARRFRDLVVSYISDLGGLDRCSEIKLGLLRRLAATTVQAELLEARLMNGEQIDVTTLCTLASTTLRIAWRLGLERVPRDVGVNSQLGEYLTRRYGKGKYPRGVSKALPEPPLVEKPEPPEPEEAP